MTGFRAFVIAVFVLGLAAPVCAQGPTINGMYVGENHALPNGGRPETRVPFPDIKDWDSLVITLYRGPCFGTCPIYSVEIHGDGRVAFDGGQFVAQMGRHEARISPRAVRRLFARFRSADFFWLNDAYKATVTDIPSFKLSLAYDNHEKTVVDYGGHFIGMPEVVSDLEIAVDDAAGTGRWIKAAEPTP